MLQELHEGHQGIMIMKSLVIMYMWWPGINADTEKSVSALYVKSEMNWGLRMNMPHVKNE